MPRLAVVPELDAELDRLYELPLEEFTGARNELVARLKRAGQDEAAARVKALRKPSLALWAVNRLARTEPDEIDRLVAAGARLREAQQAALRGGDADPVRAATRDERDALRTLTRLAEHALAEAGRPASPQTVERVNATLRAAAVEPDAAGLLRAGRLAEEPDATGFSTVAGLAPPAEQPRRARQPKSDAAARREREQRLRGLRRDAESSERAAAAAEAEAERAEKDAADARERAKHARREAREAAKALAAEERR